MEAMQDGEVELLLAPELVEEVGGAVPAGFGQTSCLWSCGLPLSAKSHRSRLWLRVVGELLAVTHETVVLAARFIIMLSVFGSWIAIVVMVKLHTVGCVRCGLRHPADDNSDTMWVSSHRVSLSICHAVALGH
ncbi:hypothetical protein HaLaN_03897 [Haematococcus lacustris]|uniref:Uncharacterized protein n=1 Tax=Haematococcus lacustris TaxID=44745 RepID=A0A699Z0I6_HAELA|nr:hypothetical protein HaLaN_03897 [Haematococcus lacustris]